MSARVFAAFLLFGVGSGVGAGRVQAAEVAASAVGNFRGRDGVVHSLKELRGHPAVINFWATWCGPCREEMPRLQRLADLYSARGVAFVAVSLDGPESEGKIDAAVAKRGLRLPVWTGATDQTLADLELGRMVPATLVLDGEGEVVGRIEGEAREKDVQVRLDWLLNGRQGRQPKVLQRNDW